MSHVMDYVDPFKPIMDAIGAGRTTRTILDPLSVITGTNKDAPGGGGGSATSPASGPATLIDPTAMPSLTSSDQRLAKRRAGAAQLARKGRASTILTNPDGLGASG